MSMMQPAVLAPLLRRVEAKELGKLALCCRSLHREASSPFFWNQLLHHDLKTVGEESNALDLYSGFMNSFYCQLCHNRMWTHRRPFAVLTASRKKRRCVCVAKRRPRKVPLRVADFNGERVDESFTWWAGFEKAREMLSDAFDTSFVQLTNLSAEELDRVDLVILNMTAAHQHLNHSEQAALANFIDSGGSAILNCFSQWSVNGDFGRMFAAALGVEVTQGAHFGSRSASTFNHVPASQELLNGPFGHCMTFENVGETEHNADTERARELGRVPLTPLVSLFPALRCSAQRSILDEHVFRVPCDDDPGNGELPGQVLLCSNFHWMCGHEFWNGGTLQRKDNSKFFLNFAASCCRALLD